MKKILPVVAVVIVALSIYAFRAKPSENEGTGIKWMTWSEMQEAQKHEPRKVYVDVYTDWCGWCKRMDQTSFVHPEVVSYINANFYAIKFDAETRETIRFRDKDYKFVGSGSRGYNELAAEMLSGRLSYPSSLYMNEEMELLFVYPGYTDPQMTEKLLNYVGGNNYKTLKFEEFEARFKSKVE